jgi:hypothetical protein
MLCRRPRRAVASAVKTFASQFFSHQLPSCYRNNSNTDSRKPLTTLSFL